MTHIEQTVIAHYSAADMAERILTLAGGPAGLTLEKLHPYDEMHIGGHPATLYFLDHFKPQSGQHILDIGCGVGGAARTVAYTTGAYVTGIDLTPDYCAAATLLSELVGLGEQTNFEPGNATSMKFRDHSFDAAYTIHAAMNIPEKTRLYGETFRVLKPGGIFGLYDVMAEPAGRGLSFPVPWATTAETSFLTTADEAATLLQQTGFTVTHTESRRDFALTALQKMHAKINDIGSPTRGTDFPQRIANLIENIEEHRCAPYILLAQKPA